VRWSVGVRCVFPWSVPVRCMCPVVGDRAVVKVAPRARQGCWRGLIVVVVVDG